LYRSFAKDSLNGRAYTNGLEEDCRVLCALTRPQSSKEGELIIL
jgi:hypothetical protein